MTAAHKMYNPKFPPAFYNSISIHSEPLRWVLNGGAALSGAQIIHSQCPRGTVIGNNVPAALWAYQ